jgi:hypothetical protein
MTTLSHELLTALSIVQTMYPPNTDNKVAFDSTVSSKWTWQVRDERMGDWYIAYEGTLWECIALSDAYHAQPDHPF